MAWLYIVRMRKNGFSGAENAETGLENAKKETVICDQFRVFTLLPRTIFFLHDEKITLPGRAEEKGEQVQHAALEAHPSCVRIVYHSRTLIG